MVDVDQAFAEVAERRAAEAEQRRAEKQLWHAHHWPHRYDRCTTIAGRHVCRRCLWFYCAAFATLFLAYVGLTPWPTSWDIAMVWLLSIPATMDFVGGELERLTYDPRRQVVVSTILGVAVGRGFFLELNDRWSWTFWGPVLVYGSLWLAVALYAFWKRKGQYWDSAAVDGA